MRCAAIGVTSTFLTLGALRTKSGLSLLFFLALFSSACAHDKYGRQAHYHLGEIHAPCASETPDNCKIKEYLRAIDAKCTTIEADCKGANELLDSLFDGTRHRKFANYILYLDQDHTPGTFHDKHHAVLMYDGRNTRYLYGVQEVYILVLTEYKACLAAQGTTIFRNEPNPLTAVLKILGKDTGISDGQIGLKTQPLPQFVWYPLSGDPMNPVMWLAIGSVPMDVNTIDWITVRFAQPVARSDKTGNLPDECVASPSEPFVPYTGTSLAHNAFFSDNRASRGAVAVAVGATFPGRKLASEGVVSPNFDGYVLIKYYLVRPTLASNPNSAFGVREYRSPSLGIAIGTNAGRICLPHERMGERLGSAKQVAEHVDSGDGAELGGAQNAHDDGLCMSAIERAIAA